MVDYVRRTRRNLIYFFGGASFIKNENKLQPVHETGYY